MAAAAITLAECVRECDFLPRPLTLEELEPHWQVHCAPLMERENNRIPILIKEERNVPLICPLSNAGQ